MNRIIILFLSIILASCSLNDENNQKNEKKHISSIDSISDDKSKEIESSEDKATKSTKEYPKYSYDLDNDKFYKRDKSLYVNRMQFAYPSEIFSKEVYPYSLDDFKNLDYNKDLYYELLNFRIPKRTEVFSKDKKQYAIDFPKSENYGIRIYFNTLLEDESYRAAEIKNLLYSKTEEFMENIKENNKINIIQEPFEISDSQKDTYYFIGENEKTIHTFIFVACPKNIVYFDIAEEKGKSDVSKYIMADLLSSMYIESEDPINVKKNFDSFRDKIDLYATKKVDFNKISIKIPDPIKTLQDNDNFKAFAKEDRGEIVTQILLIRSPKNDEKDNESSLEDTFNKTSGSSFPPAYIVSMGKVSRGKINDKDSLSSEIRIYMDNYTSQGVKTCIETEDEYLTILVTGPLANSNEIRLLTKNIINTLEFE